MHRPHLFQRLASSKIALATTTAAAIALCEFRARQIAPKAAS